MEGYGILYLLCLVGLPLFLEWFPRRPKWHYDKEEMLDEYAHIEHIFASGEGSRKQRRIRTSVIFSDGFEYSACLYSRSGLFTISASQEEQLEVANRAIKKHNQIIEQVKGIKLSEKKAFTKEQQEIVDHYRFFFERSVEQHRSIVEKLPGNKLALEALRKEEIKLEKLMRGDAELFAELRPRFEEYKKMMFEEVMSYCNQRIEYYDKQITALKKEKMDSGLSEDDIVMRNKEIEKCQNMLQKDKEFLKRLEDGDYELCQELRIAYGPRES